jgi:hypothetical protein
VRPSVRRCERFTSVSPCNKYPEILDATYDSQVSEIKTDDCFRMHGLGTFPPNSALNSFRGEFLGERYVLALEVFDGQGKCQNDRGETACRLPSLAGGLYRGAGSGPATRGGRESVSLFRGVREGTKVFVFFFRGVSQGGQSPPCVL